MTSITIAGMTSVGLNIADLAEVRDFSHTESPICESGSDD